MVDTQEAITEIGAAAVDVEVAVEEEVIGVEVVAVAHEALYDWIYIDTLGRSSIRKRSRAAPWETAEALLG